MFFKHALEQVQNATEHFGRSETKHLLYNRDFGGSSVYLSPCKLASIPGINTHAG